MEVPSNATYATGFRVQNSALLESRGLLTPREAQSILGPSVFYGGDHSCSTALFFDQWVPRRAQYENTKFLWNTPWVTALIGRQGGNQSTEYLPDSCCYGCYVTGVIPWPQAPVPQDNPLEDPRLLGQAPFIPTKSFSRTELRESRPRATNASKPWADRISCEKLSGRLAGAPRAGILGRM